MAGLVVTALIVLAMDVSSSVTSGNYELQRDATAAAFRSQAVQEGIIFSPRRCVGALVLEWSTEQHVTVPWTLICTTEQANAFADRLQSTKRSSEGYTFVGDAISAAVGLFASAPWSADKRVIDVSGDGVENGSRVMEADQARTLAESHKVRINGLSIDADQPKVHEWYREHVRTRDGFCFESVGWESFGRAIELKIREEIAFASELQR